MANTPSDTQQAYNVNTHNVNDHLGENEKPGLNHSKQAVNSGEIGEQDEQKMVDLSSPKTCPVINHIPVKKILFDKVKYISIKLEKNYIFS